MLEKYLNPNIYGNKPRVFALILTSLIPLLLLFSRAIADGVLTIVGILFLIESFKNKQYAWTKQPAFFILFSLWAWFIIGSIFAYHNVSASLGVSFVYIRFILFFFACISWLLTDIESLKLVTKIITITLLIAALDTLFQFITGSSSIGESNKFGERLTSFLSRPNIGIYFAKLIFPIAGLWLWLAIKEKNNKGIVLSIAFLAFVVTVIMLTGERTATALAISAICGILLILGILNKSFRWLVIIGISSVSAILLLIASNSSFIYKRSIDFVTDISNFQYSLYGQLFKGSILVWQKFGFYLGVGIRQFREACPAIQNLELVTYCDLHSHNIYLEILSESGIIGLMLFCAFVILCLWQVYKAMDLNDVGKLVNSACALGGIYIILFPISVTMSFIANWSATLNWLGISLCISALQLSKEKLNNKKIYCQFNESYKIQNHYQQYMLRLINYINYVSSLYKKPS